MVVLSCAWAAVRDAWSTMFYGVDQLRLEAHPSEPYFALPLIAVVVYGAYRRKEHRDTSRFGDPTLGSQERESAVRLRDLAATLAAALAGMLGAALLICLAASYPALEVVGRFPTTGIIEQRVVEYHLLLAGYVFAWQWRSLFLDQALIRAGVRILLFTSVALPLGATIVSAVPRVAYSPFADNPVAADVWGTSAFMLVWVVLLALGRTVKSALVSVRASIQQSNLAGESMRLLTLVVTLGIGLLGFYLLQPNMIIAALWLVFVVVASPLAVVVVSTDGYDQAGLLEMYKAGLAALPMIGRFFSAHRHDSDKGD